RLDGVERRPQLVAGGIQDARLLPEIPLQGEIVLRFLLRHHGEKLAVGRPLARRQHHHLGHELLAAALAREQVREMKAGLAEDERPPLRNAHGAEGPEPLREEALLRERFALRVHLEMPGQLVERPRMAERGIDQGCHPIHALTAGRDTATVVPRPGSLSTRTVPCCAATSSWTMERPSPVPEPGGLVVKKGSKIRERFSLVIPQPLSMTESSTPSPLCLRPKRSSWRVTAVSRSTLSSMSAISGAVDPTELMCLRSRARFPRRKWMGLLSSCATPAIIRPSATIFSLCTSEASAFFSCSSASRSFCACDRSRRCSSMRARNSWRSKGLWT